MATRRRAGEDACAHGGVAARHEDPQGRYARDLGSAYKYWVGIHNGSPDSRTLHDVTVRALEGEFTSEALSVAARQDGEREPC